jgi:hypothetical protein
MTTKEPRGASNVYRNCALLQLNDAMPRRLGALDELALPEILPGFSVAVRAFFPVNLYLN